MSEVCFTFYADDSFEQSSPRLCTVLMYLKDDGLEGGETAFPVVSKTHSENMRQALQGVWQHPDTPQDSLLESMGSLKRQNMSYAQQEHTLQPWWLSSSFKPCPTIDLRDGQFY